MKGLIIKDFLTIKKSLRMIAIMIIPFGIFAYTLESPGYIAIMVTLLCATPVLSTFNYDEYYHWNNYAVTFPISKKDIVKSKYAFLVIMELIGLVLGSVISAIISLALKVEMTETLIQCLVFFLVLLLVYSFVIPVCFKVGAEKARIAMFLIYILPFIIVFFLYKMLDEATVLRAAEYIENNMTIIGVGATVLTLVIVFISYLVSCKIFEGKDM